MRPKISRIEVWSGRPEPAVDFRADADVAEDEAVHGREAPAHVLLDVLPALALARRELVAEARLEERRGLVVEGRARVAAPRRPRGREREQVARVVPARGLGAVPLAPPDLGLRPLAEPRARRRRRAADVLGAEARRRRRRGPVRGLEELRRPHGHGLVGAPEPREPRRLAVFQGHRAIREAQQNRQLAVADAAVVVVVALLQAAGVLADAALVVDHVVALEDQRLDLAPADLQRAGRRAHDGLLFHLLLADGGAAALVSAVAVARHGEGIAGPGEQREREPGGRRHGLGAGLRGHRLSTSGAPFNIDLGALTRRRPPDVVALYTRRTLIVKRPVASSFACDQRPANSVAARAAEFARAARPHTSLLQPLLLLQATRRGSAGARPGPGCAKGAARAGPTKLQCKVCLPSFAWPDFASSKD